MEYDRTPLVYIGNKYRLAKRVLPLLPPHAHYIEPFAGGLGMLYAKAPTKAETINDIDGNVVAFYRVLREQPRKLKRLLQLTPFSRRELAISRANLKNPDISDLERARSFFVASRQSFNGKIYASGYSLAKDAPKAPAFVSTVDMLDQLAERLRGVNIEEGDFARIFRIYDSHSSLFYCDPCYHYDAKYRCYRYMMSEEDQNRFLKIIVRIKGMAVVSGYQSKKYDAALEGWKRYDFDQTAGVDLTKGMTRRRVTECVWLNPRAAFQSALASVRQTRNVTALG